MANVVLVTGATGFVGAHIARFLLSKGLRVRVLARPESPLTNLQDLDGIEIVRGNLLDRKSLKHSVRDAQFIFHAAADYRLWVPNPKEMYAVNVDGTRYILEESKIAGVDRVVYTSTVGTIGQPKQGLIADENDEAHIDQIIGPYKKSKFLAERVVKEIADGGFPVVIVNPSAPIGHMDLKPTPTGKIILDFLNGDLPAYLDTGLNFVDVEDVAKGHWLALQKGKPGRRYILGGENLLLKDFLERLGVIANLPAPKTKLPYFVAYAAGMLDTIMCSMLNKTPSIPLTGVRMAKRKMFFRSYRAEEELGYKPDNIDVALSKAIRWFSDHGYLKKGKK